MAVARVFDGNGWTIEQYDALIEGLMERMNLDGTSAPGVLFHWAGPVEGGVRAIDVYESRKAADTLAQDHIAPVAQELGLSMPEIAEYEVHRYLTP